MKKKLFLLTLMACYTLSIKAQLPVSTTAENKNVVLEEFTGIYCQFCPDGHKRANDLAAANPGDVVLINIHVGSYAAPSGEDPDYRTQWGSAIVGQTGLTGYPAGTINRHLFSGMSQGSGTAMSRGDWATAAGQVLSQPSYVNVALEGDIDLATNTLTVDVEMYFTGSSAPGSVNLNVALLQDDIQGPQIDGGNYNPTQWLANGKYNHQHMLRHLLTGQWGDVITTTTMGQLVQKQYTYNLPTDINGVPMEIPNLEIVAFVAEGQQEIVTGATGPINIVIPPGMSETDLEVSAANTVIPDDHCTYDITPEVSIKNNSSLAVDSFEVSYSLNGGAPVSQWVTTSVGVGASTNVTFPQATLSNGENKISYEVSVNNVFKYVDLTSANNMMDGEAIYTVEPTPFSTHHRFSFEGEAVGEKSPFRTVAVNPGDIDAYVVDKSVTNTISYDIGARGTKSFRWRLNSIPQGESSALLVEKLDFSQETGHKVFFYYAYGQISASDADKLEVKISKDCGATWETIWSEQGSAMATTSPNSSSYYYPHPSEWGWVPLDVSHYDGEPEVLVMFEATSDVGNTLYIDEVEIVSSATISTDEFEVSEAANTLNLFPNPASKFTYLEVELANDADVELSISDVSGKQVKNLGVNSLSNGSHKLEIDLEDLNPGVYFINVNMDGVISNERLVITD